MQFSLPPHILFGAATLFVTEAATLAWFARYHGVSPHRLRHELVGIIPGRYDTLDNWLDAVPGRRDAFDAYQERQDADVEAALVSFEADSERISAKLDAMIADYDASELPELLDG